jgi:glycosyltransferase involved in cell wall biosynthesis
MKFLFNTSCYKPAYKQGGPLHSVSSLAEGLVKKGHEVIVSAPNLDLGERLDVDLNRDYIIDGVRVRFFNAEPTFLQKTGIPYFAKASVYGVDPNYRDWLEIEGANADVLHSHLTFTPENYLVSRYAEQNNKIYFYNQRGNLDPVRLEIGKWKKMAFILLRERGIMRRADALLGLTSHEISTFGRFAPNNRVEVIPNGIASDFADREPDVVRPEIQAILDTCGEDPVFFWMSRIHHTKGADIFVDAVVQALQTGVQFHAIIAGPDEVGLELELKNKVMSAGLQERIHFSGPVAGDDRLALLKRADSFVLPTISEGFSMVILEALASGCAVLTSPGAYFDEIEESGSGRILARSVEAYVSAIAEYAKLGTEGIRAISERGVALVNSRYTWDSIVEDYLKLAQELVETKEK